MKRKTFFFVSLAALAARVTICSAQEGEQHREQASGGGGGQGGTIVADRDAAIDQVARAIDQARSAGANTIRLRTTSRSAGRALVIPKDVTDAKSLAEVEEDVRVMAHILAKAVGGENKAPRAMGIYISSPFGSASPQDLYIEGHGALFFLNVNYPLLPPPVKEKEPAEKEKNSSEWDEARRELSGQPRSTGGGGTYAAGGTWRLGELPVQPGTSQTYDADKVEDLKNDIISALRNAAHIRKLKSDETVTVVVSGPIAGKGNRKVVTASDSSGADYGWEMYQAVLGEAPASSGPSAKMIVRAKKSDADAFQNGKLTSDEFRRKVTVMVY